MTKSYAQLLKQMKALEVEAEKARRKEVEGVIGRIREAITVYGLSAEDLGFTSKAKPGRKPAAVAKKRGRKPGKPVREVKFRNEAGDSWVGRGKRPQWLRDALASGKTLQDFAVK